MGYKKDIFAVFAYEFESSHILVKSFAIAHGEIQNLFWMKYFAEWQNVKLNPPTRRRGEFHPPVRVDLVEKTTCQNRSFFLVHLSIL